MLQKDGIISLKHYFKEFLFLWIFLTVVPVEREYTYTKIITTLTVHFNSSPGTRSLKQLFLRPENKLKFFESLAISSDGSRPADSKPEFSAKLGSINPASAETSDHPPSFRDGIYVRTLFVISAIFLERRSRILFHLIKESKRTRLTV